MKMSRFAPLVMALVISGLHPFSAWPALNDVLKGLERAAGGDRPSEMEIIRGLKQALEVGTQNAVKRVSKFNGYYGNPDIRIPMPGAIGKAENLIRFAGYGPELDAFVLSMNRAAERAAPQAKAIFWDALKEMSFSDAGRILNGRDDEATRYFQSKTRDQLTKAFMPAIHTTMSKVGVTRAYQDLDAKAQEIPLVGELSFDLDRYVTDRAMDGLFHVLAEEERKIRQEPAARVTDILKKVFGQ